MSKNSWLEEFEKFINDVSEISNKCGTAYTCEDEIDDSTEGVGVKKIIIAGKKTIVLFDDGTKTISTCLGKDKYSLEAGISICMLKKVFGNNAVGKFFKDVEKAYKDGDSEYVYIQEPKKKKCKTSKKENGLNE